MSQRKVNGRWVNEGPASASASGVVEAVDRLGVPGLAGIGVAVGAGPIERRLATAEELAGARARDARSTPLKRAPVTTSAAMTTASRQRGAQANKARIEALRAREEEPVVPEPVAPPAQEPAVDPNPFTVLADAAVEAAEALDDLIRARSRYEQTTRAVDNCVRVLAGRPPRRPVDLDAAIASLTKPMEPPDEDRVDPVPIGGGPGEMPLYIRRIVDAMVAADGDREVAAAALGYKATSLTGSLPRIRKRTDLTDVERAAVATKRRG